MDTPLVISATMLRRLCHMTDDEKRTLFHALIDDEVLGVPHEPMSAEMEMYYMMFRHGVSRESRRYDRALQASDGTYAVVKAVHRAAV